MRPLIAAVLLVSWIGSATAQTPGVHLSWSECLPKGGTRDLDFSCDTVDGSEILLVTFSPAVPAPRMVALETVLDISTCLGPGCSGPVLPDWWRLEPANPGLGNPAGCRAPGLTFSLDYTLPPYSVGTGCDDPWQLNGSGAFSYEYPSSLAGGNPSVAVLLAVAVVPASKAVALLPGVEYYAFRFIIDNKKTVGLPSNTCDGCCVPMVLSPSYLQIRQPIGLGDFMLTGASSDAITWQGRGGPCGPTPAIRRTWGMMKSLYR